MGELFANGRIVELILVVMLVEAVGSLLLNSKLARGIAPASVIFNLGAGAALMLALRAALLHEAWPAIAAWLLMALLGHAGELWVRWTAPAPLDMHRS
jgi:hypothetical protein